MDTLHKGDNDDDHDNDDNNNGDGGNFELGTNLPTCNFRFLNLCMVIGFLEQF
jgi:hypothetical protein